MKDDDIRKPYDHFNYTKIFGSWYDWRRAVDSIDRIVIYARNKAGDIQPVACYGANDSQTVRFVFTREMIDRLAEITGQTFNDRQRIAKRRETERDQ